MRQTTEDYLKAIYILQSKNSYVRAVDIAAYFSVSKPTVSIHLKHLSQEDYIYIDDSHGIYLTEKGKNIAGSVVDKHEIFRQLLEELGVEQKIAEKDACLLEHAISPESFSALKKFVSEHKINSIG